MTLQKWHFIPRFSVQQKKLLQKSQWVLAWSILQPFIEQKPKICQTQLRHQKAPNYLHTSARKNDAMYRKIGSWSENCNADHQKQK